MSSDYCFEDYINKQIGKLQLINIKDACMGIAITLFYSGDLPKGVLTKSKLEELKKIKYSKSIEHDVRVVELLKPVQNWLLNIVCKAIKQKEIKPEILSVDETGNINSTKTFIQDGRVIKFLGYRGIHAEVYGNESTDWKWFNDSYHRIYKCVLDVSNRLSNEINRRYLSQDKHSPAQDEHEVLETNSEPFTDFYSQSEIQSLKKENEKLKIKIQEVDYQQVDKHMERHAVNREQVLGAALSVVCSFQEQCKNKRGKIEATKICNLIEEKSPLFWPDTGEPILSTESIERLIRKWMKKTV